jgi:hypothetical protein
MQANSFSQVEMMSKINFKKFVGYIDGVNQTIFQHPAR